MRIVTVGREFSSGGRELGKRLADELGFAYYDREIITEIAKRTELDEHYIASRAEQGIIPDCNVTFGRTFAYPSFAQQNDIKILVSERHIINDIVGLGKDFVIVGRSADVLLRAYKPFNLFVYADMKSKIERCRARLGENEQMSDKQIEKKIKQIDSGRARHRELISNGKWGAKECYNLCINTSDTVIKDIVPFVADIARSWFERNIK